MTRRWIATLLALLALLGACGDDGGTETSAAGSAAALREPAPAVSPSAPEDVEREEQDEQEPEELVECGSHGSAGELAQTPRADEEAELLALSLSDGLTADQAIYERVLRDLRLIRDAHEDVASITHHGDHDGRALIGFVSNRIAGRMDAGTYVPEWDCLNEHYELEGVSRQLSGSRSQMIILTFEGRYDIGLVIEDYAALPGFESLGPNSFLDGSDICAAIDGETYRYVFDEGSGDCMSGCIDHRYTFFTVSAAGSVRRRGSWTNRGRARKPDWVDLCD